LPPFEVVGVHRHARMERQRVGHRAL